MGLHVPVEGNEEYAWEAVWNLTLLIVAVLSEMINAYTDEVCMHRMTMHLGSALFIFNQLFHS